MAQISVCSDISRVASDNYLERRVASGMNVTGRLVVVVPWLSSNPFVGIRR